MNKKPILHLYGSKEETTTAFHDFIEKHKQYVEKVYYRDLVVICEDSTNCFVIYKDHVTSRQNELNAQWYDIKFNLDLPEDVKNHFLSRIRWTV